MTTRNGMTGEHQPESIKDAVKDLVDQGREKVEAKVAETKVRVVEVKDQAISKGNALIERAADMIKAHPLRSVGIAFGAGYIGMRLFRR